jgi:hypothetical protein
MSLAGEFLLGEITRYRTSTKSRESNGRLQAYRLQETGEYVSKKGGESTCEEGRCKVVNDL